MSTIDPRDLVAAVSRSIDAQKLGVEIASLTKSDRVSYSDAALPMPREVLDKIVLADILDDSIVGARSGDKSFPLRLFLGDLAARLAHDHAFALASGLNFFFRGEMDDDAKLKLGFEVSRAYYNFAKEAQLEPQLVSQVSPLLASLMNSELQRVRLESVDHQSVFDSSVHEREEKANASSARIQRPASFLCRVTSNNMVRVKARVMT